VPIIVTVTIIITGGVTMAPMVTAPVSSIITTMSSPTR
jgi:hypothetical protein